MIIDSLKYPIGKFSFPASANLQELTEIKQTIKQFPALISQAVNNLSIETLQWTYRPEGWSIIQLVHHCADSHMNSLTRFKWTVTEDNPTIKTYNEAEWAKLVDANTADIHVSLSIITGIHHRWSLLLDSFEDEEWNKTLFHPEMGRKLSLSQMGALYNWHCKHHLAHIELAKLSKGKYND